jgi:hypothetical protein
MKLKIAAFVMLAVLIGFAAWACITWPVIETPGVWVDYEYEAKNVAPLPPVKRPPTVGEVMIRGVACGTSLILGVALIRHLRSKSHKVALSRLELVARPVDQQQERNRDGKENTV